MSRAAGTEVTKKRRPLILTNDNCAILVHAVREGRGIYDNLVKYS